GVQPGAHGGVLLFAVAVAGPTGGIMGGQGWAADPPPHYVAVLRVRGHAPPNQLQLKLVDPSGANVWWWRRPNFAPSEAPEMLVLRKASLEFAWGPKSGGEPDRIGAVELALAAGPGGAGTMWIEELRIEARDPAAALPRIHTVSASSCVAGHEPTRALDHDDATDWRPDSTDAQPWLQLDLGQVSEWGGFVID